MLPTLSADGGGGISGLLCSSDTEVGSCMLWLEECCPFGQAAGLTAGRLWTGNGQAAGTPG